MVLLHYRAGPHHIEITCCAQPTAVADEAFEAQAFLVLDDDTPPVTAALSAPSAAEAVERVREYLDSMGYDALVPLARQGPTTSVGDRPAGGVGW